MLAKTEPQSESIVARQVNNKRTMEYLPNRADGLRMVEKKRNIPALEYSWELETFYDLTRLLSEGLKSGRLRNPIFDNSRGRLDLILEWTNEFNNDHAWTDWNNGAYLEVIDQWFEDKISNIKSSEEF